MKRFPQDCDSKCPHLHSWDMSIDDCRNVCGLLGLQCDDCDEDYSVAICPLENSYEQDYVVKGGTMETNQKKFVQIHKGFYSDSIKALGIDIKSVNGVFMSNDEVVITGHPKDDDELHNCDEMGCSSVNHVLHRHKL